MRFAALPALAASAARLLPHCFGMGKMPNSAAVCVPYPAGLSAAAGGFAVSPFRRRALAKALFALFSAAFTLPAAAQAAPALRTPEPEPAEENYLRACDAFGKGYFYIPGTDTCLRISGYVRSEAQGGDHLYARTYKDRQRSTYNWLSRGTLRMHTASETDWGTMRSFAELRSDWQSGAPNGASGNGDTVSGSLRFAYIELGGLRVGMDETIFAYWTGYYGNIINDDIMNPANTRTNGISYTFNTPGGFSAIFGAEQGNASGKAGNIVYFDDNHVGDNATISTNMQGGYRFGRDGRKHYKQLSTQTANYMPNLVAGLKYEKDWGSVSSVLGYDSYDSELATKLRFDLNLSNRFSIFLMGGYKTMGDYYNYDTSYGNNAARIVGYRSDGSPIRRYGVYRQVNALYGDWGGHGIGWFGGTYKFTPQTSFNFQNVYAGEKSFSSSANITQQFFSGLTVILELSYKAWNDDFGYRKANGDAYRVSLKGKEAVQGALRVQRAF